MSALSLVDGLIQKIDGAEQKEDNSDIHKPNANDILEINNIISEYMHCLDNGDGVGMANLFIKNGKCEIKKINKTISGSDGIKTFCINLHERFKTTSHFESNVVIKFDGANKATNVSYWKGINEGNIVSYGLHKDTFIKDTDNHWKFNHRIIEHTWSKK